MLLHISIDVKSVKSLSANNSSSIFDQISRSNDIQSSHIVFCSFFGFGCKFLKVLPLVFPTASFDFFVFFEEAAKNNDMRTLYKTTKSMEMEIIMILL